MPLTKKELLLSLLGLTACALPLTVSADTTYTWQMTSSSYCVGACPNGATTMTFNNTTFSGPSVAANGWANTEPGVTNNRLAAAGLYIYSGSGLGAQNADEAPESSPEHAVDNTDRYELVLFDFGAGSTVELTQIRMGWIGNDADVSLLAFTGGGANDPAVNNVLYSGSSEGLTANGWEVAGNYQFGTSETSVNAGGLSSRYWIVAAYNPNFSAAGCVAGVCVEGNDQFKIKYLKGTHRTPPDNPNPPSEVPVPAPLLLMAAGLLWFGRRAVQKG